MKSGALANQLIAFTRSLREALPVKYRHLPATALDQPRAFQLPGSESPIGLLTSFTFLWVAHPGTSFNVHIAAHGITLPAFPLVPNV
jgi:hypothetical protein